MNFNKFFQSKAFKIVLFIMAVLVALLLVFKAGVFVGYKKAQYSYRWGENYHRNFGGPRGGFFGDFKRGFGDKEFINAHGTFGSIIAIDMATTTNRTALTVKGDDAIEKTVLVSEKTAILKNRETVAPADLRIDDRAVVIGSPNDQGQIEAKLIRIFGKESGKLPPKKFRFRF